MSDITPWLQSLGLEKYDELLSSHDIDLAVAPDLTEQDLEKLGLSLGHRRKFIAAAAKLRGVPAPADVSAKQVRSGAQAEALVGRRQMTVVFIDLVGSTALGGDLDPEDLIDLLRLYRDACVEVIGKYDGFIAQYLGDGILVYFGFPVAQEHAAERAVRAALEIVEKVGRLKRPDGQPLQTRVGIATGLVVAGEAGGVGPAGEETVVGDTPNLAARLQSEAEPGCVLVSSSTHRITEDFFEYSFLGTHAIKGLPFDAPRSLTPDQVYAVCAYVLFLNHLVPEGAVLDAASLPKIEMPNRAGFVSAYPPRSENPAPWLNPPTWKYAEGDYDDRRFAQLYDGAGPPQRLAETL